MGGAFFHGVNVEFRIRVPLGTHEIAYYNLPERDGRSREMKLMPGTGFEFLAGYGIPLSGRFRLTPSAGIGFTPFIGRATDLSMRVQRSYIFSGLGALKAEYALSPSFSLVVTPGYAVPFGRDAFVRNFETTRPAVKSWYSGFFVHLGVHFNFEEK